MKLLLSLILFITILFQPFYSFENTIWKGTTSIYKTGLNKKLNFNDITYNYNITKFSLKEKKINYLNLRLRSYDKIGGIISSIPKIQNWKIDNKKSYISEFNFFQDTIRSVIIFNYTYDDLYNLKLSSINTSALRCGKVKKYRMRLNIINISNFLNLITKFNFCKTTTINPFYPNSQEISYSTEYDYTYFFKNEDRINNIFTDNLIISIPTIIDDYKPFTFIIGCFISQNNYKQLNINYNFNGVLISIDYNEYNCE